MPAWFYILRLTSGKLYSGATRSLPKRMEQHSKGEGGRTTRLDPPRTVAHTEEFDTYREALRREAQVKRWTRAKKEALTAGDIERLKKLAKRKA
jgi:predicted GIY-YIG superfamily endonuclease